MRSFGKDKPELLSFTIGTQKKVYSIPLAASMPAVKILELNEAYEQGELAAAKGQYKLLKDYIGDIADTLTAKDINEIFDAWGKESESQGADVGE